MSITPEELERTYIEEYTQPSALRDETLEPKVQEHSTIRKHFIEEIRQGGPKLDPEFKRNWVEALRSGEYQQGMNHLFDTGPSGPSQERYCCLGVACVTAGVEKDVIYQMDLIDEGVLIGFQGERGDQEPFPVPDMLFGEPSLSNVEGVIIGILTWANDRGFSFEDIANWIEARL